MQTVSLQRALIIELDFSTVTTLLFLLPKDVYLLKTVRELLLTILLYFCYPKKRRDVMSFVIHELIRSRDQRVKKLQNEFDMQAWRCV